MTDPVHHEHDIAGVDELHPGESKTFTLECDGRRVEAFLVNYRDTFHAYVNQCRHVPMTLDWVENRFFTDDGDHILCATHGALYEPDTGLCIDGPPCGRSLFRIPIRIEGGRVVVRCPPEPPP